MRKIIFYPHLMINGFQVIKIYFPQISAARTGV